MSVAGSDGLQQLVTAEFFVSYVGEGVIVNHPFTNHWLPYCTVVSTHTTVQKGNQLIYNHPSGWLVGWVLY